MGAYDVLKKHGVTRLCHFTKVQSLAHILLTEDGIISTAKLSDKSKQVDKVRADGELEFVCCSVEYPNSWFLENAKSRNESEIFREWAIIYIDIEILKKRDVKVCECNAAKDCGRYICVGDDKNTENLFVKKVNSFKYPRTDMMLSCCPTNSQSEIMIKDGIPREYIKGIAVGDLETANTVYAMKKTLGVESIDLYIAPDVVSKRWSDMIRRGIRPREERFTC